MSVFISGGCKNGKSSYAQNLAKEMSLKSGKPLFYIDTVEQGKMIRKCLRSSDGVFLLDNVTALLTNDELQCVAGEILQFAEETDNTIFVADNIYTDTILYEELTEDYRLRHAAVDKGLAKICDQVIEVSFGTAVFHKNIESEGKR